MSSISSSFLILGLVLTSVTADGTTISGAIFTDSEGLNSSLTNDINSTTATPLITTGVFSTSSVSSTMNMTDANSTMTPSTTKQTGNNASENSQTTTVTKSSPAPGTTTKSMKPITKKKDDNRDESPNQASLNDKTGIIILVVIIIIALVFAVACYCARNRGRRYSVDFTSRQDDTHIPLSTVQPEMPDDASPQNGLKTFESAETVTKEPEEPETKPEEQSLPQEEQKAEADKSVVDPSAESAAPAPSETPAPSEAPAPSAAPAPSTESAGDKPKEDAVEQSPPPPVEPSLEEKTDDEDGVSTKTSVESLKETNENNRNNINQQRDLKSSNLFWDVPLNCPV